MGGVGRTKQDLSLGSGIFLVFTIGPGAATGTAYQSTGTAPTGSTDSSYPGQGVPATAEELQSVVAPIALYPNALVAQILSAATFPDLVAIASYWLEQNSAAGAATRVATPVGGPGLPAPRAGASEAVVVAGAAVVRPND
jgi:hypothetical protein